MTDDIVTYARERIRKGSKSFAGTAGLLEPASRTHAYLLYAWCRHCDDVIDGQDLGFAVDTPDERPPEQRLADLFEKTERAIAGDADEPVYQGLARVVREAHIPARHPLELLEGFRMDVAERTYETADEVASYCYHVAGVVGVMMAMVMGVRDRATLERASDLGIGFQMTNIARDVMADAAAGRIYLPHEWLREAGIRPCVEQVLAPENRGAIFAVTARLLDTADAYYDLAGYGIARLPLRAAIAIATARNVYRKIGSVVRSRGASAWDTRAFVSRPRKAIGLAAATLTVLSTRIPGAAALPPPRTGLWTMPGLGD